MRKPTDSRGIANGGVLHYAVVGVICTLLVLGALRQYSTASRSAPSFGVRLRAQAAIGLDSPSVADSRTADRRDLFFIFQPDDCPGIIAPAILALNELDLRESLDVHGLVLSRSGPSINLQELAEKLGVEFALSLAEPILVLPMLADLGYRRTPIAVLVGIEREIEAVITAPHLEMLGGGG